ncbi:serine protease [Patescibacteria group bacterium]|nr:serine protease [Patescibacteria group bacterium]MBU4481593.1 serine protease [Patescibacteria group bacterium]
MLKNIFKIIGIFVLGILGGILGGIFAQNSFFYKYNPEPAPVYINKTEKIVIQENIALKNAIGKVEKTVIGIRTETKKGKFLEGSGLILTSDGLFVTLAELVPKGGSFNFFFEGKKVKAQILTRKEDLALIQLEEKNLPTASFGNLAQIKLGERVFLVGVIFEKEEPKKMVNEGIIKYVNENLIQTNIFEKKAAGSPLFDIEGNTLGLNYVSETGEVRTIPISKIRKFANL